MKGQLPLSLKSASKWSVKCSIQVEKSGICTYFMTVGFRPGGYCGIEASKQYFQSRIMEMLMLNLLKPIQKQKVLSLRLSWILLGRKAHQSLLRLKIDNDWRCSCEISTNGTNRFMSTVKRMLMESHS